MLICHKTAYINENNRICNILAYFTKSNFCLIKVSLTEFYLDLCHLDKIPSGQCYLDKTSLGHKLFDQIVVSNIMFGTLLYHSNMGIKTSVKINRTSNKCCKQEGVELCQAQPAKHKLFGFNGAIFWFELLLVVLMNC